MFSILLWHFSCLNLNFKTWQLQNEHKKWNVLKGAAKKRKKSCWRTSCSTVKPNNAFHNNPDKSKSLFVSRQSFCFAVKVCGLSLWKSSCIEKGLYYVGYYLFIFLWFCHLERVLFFSLPMQRSVPDSALAEPKQRRFTTVSVLSVGVCECTAALLGVLTWNTRGRYRRMSNLYLDTVIAGTTLWETDDKIQQIKTQSVLNSAKSSSEVAAGRVSQIKSLSRTATSW